MTGEGLYAAWCEQLRAGWRTSTGIMSACAPGGLLQPSSPPVAWSFLTQREREAWNALAEQLGPREVPSHPLALRPLG